MKQLLDRTKLIALCNLRSSAQGDEIITAGRRADALVKASGYTWSELLGDAGAFKDKSVVEPDGEMLETIDDYLDYEVWFSTNDVLFLKTIRQMVAAGFDLNNRQRDWLEHIRNEVANIVSIQRENTKG
jgi:hypothetical protein